MSTVQLNNVKKAFGKTEVLHGIDPCSGSSPGWRPSPRAIS
jgi:hypothetical protein